MSVEGVWLQADSTDDCFREEVHVGLSTMSRLDPLLNFPVPEIVPKRCAWLR